MEDENAQDEPAETPEDDWKRYTFYISVNSILNSSKNWFEKNQPLLQVISNKFIYYHTGFSRGFSFIFIFSNVSDSLTVRLQATTCQ